MAILAATFSMVAFGMSARPADYALQCEADVLAGWIRGATMWAAERNRGYFLEYDLRAGALSVWAAGTAQEPTTRAANYSLKEPVRMAGVVLAREGVQLVTDGVVAVRVWPNGTCEPHLVYLEQEGMGTMTLEVNPVTGDVVVFEGRCEYEFLAQDTPG